MVYIAKKSTFEKRYPLFSDLGFDDAEREILNNNEDLYRKYTAYNQSLDKFLFELRKRFDIETVRSIVDELIHEPDEIMISVITSYLNSDDVTKCNRDFMKFYNKTSNFGTDSIMFIQKNGIVANVGYKNIPNLAIDDKYDELSTGRETFKGEELSKVYETMSYDERDFINNLLKNNSFNYLNQLFLFVNLNLTDLVKILKHTGVDGEIINDTVYESLGNYLLTKLVYALINPLEDSKLLKNVKVLIRDNRLDLLSAIVNFELLGSLANLDTKELDEINDSVIFDKLNVIGQTLELV